MAAAVNVESDGSVRDLFQDPPFDLQNVRFDVTGPVSKDDLDVETLETLYNQLLREIYDRIGVTALYPLGKLPACHEPTVKLLMSQGLMGTDSFTKFAGYRTLYRHAKVVTGQYDQELPEDIKNLIPCPSAPVLLSSIVLVIFRKPLTGSPSDFITSMFCVKKVVKWLNLAIRIYERNRTHLMFISVDDGYDLDDGRQSQLIDIADKKYLYVKSHSVDDSVFQHEIDQYFEPDDWTGFSDHDNPSGDEMDLDIQHVTSNESVQPDSDDKLQKLCTMLHRHEPAFLKFAEESPKILLNFTSAANDLMKLTIQVQKTHDDMAAKAKRQTERDKKIRSILENVNLAFQYIKANIETMKQGNDVTNAKNVTKINASIQERLNETVAGIFTQVNASMQERLNETVAGIFTQVNASMQERLNETVAENVTKINASMQERLNKTVAEISTHANTYISRLSGQINDYAENCLDSTADRLSTQVNASLQERLNETIAGISTQVNASMQNGAELYEQAVLSALEESDILKTIVERAVAKLQPHVNRQIVNGDSALDEDMQ